jgi:hypothetical protein
MPYVTQRDIDELLNERLDGPFISIFAPMEPANKDTQQNRIRLKNLTKKIESELENKTMRKSDIVSFLEPILQLETNAEFWHRQEAGVAIFVARDFARYYKLPIAVDERAIVGHRFFVKPLLASFGEDRRYYILALSQNRIRFLHATQYNMAEIVLDEAPTSLVEALGYELTEQHLESHTGVPTAPGGDQIFHGQGAGKDDHKMEIRRFFGVFNQAFGHFLARQRLERNVPLVLVGVDYLLPIFKERCSYPRLIEDSVLGNPDGFSDHELHHKTWAVMKPYFAQARARAVAQFSELAGTGLASGQLDGVVLSAIDGRVDTLFVDAHQQVWAVVRPDQRKVTVQSRATSDTEDVLDRAAVETFRHGGTVYVSEPDQIPGGNPLAAIYRY